MSSRCRCATAVLLGVAVASVGCGDDSESVCGNGVVEAPEACDDGNAVNDDACSNTCQANSSTGGGGAGAGGGGAAGGAGGAVGGAGGAGGAGGTATGVIIEPQVRVNAATPIVADQPAVCNSGSNVYAVWRGDGQLDIYFNRSTDGGRTWQPQDTRLNTEPVATLPSGSPVICCDGQDVYVAWEDERDGEDDVYVNYSHDGGQSWQSSDVRVEAGIAGEKSSQHVQIACEGDSAYVVYKDNRFLNDFSGDEIFFSRSVDGGATWLATDVRLDTDAQGAGDSEWPSLCKSGNNLYVAWEEGRNGTTDVYFNVSTDDGVNWLASDVRLDSGVGASTDPKVSCDGDRVYVTWRDDRDGEPDIYVNVSGDAGASWLVSDVRVSSATAGSAASHDPEICSQGGNLYVLWADERVGNGQAGVFLNRSSDAGATWLPQDQRVDLGTDVANNVRMCCSPNRVYAVWVDNSQDPTGDDVFVSFSSDAGQTWYDEALRLDTDPAGTVDTDDPFVSCDDAAAYAVWPLEPRGDIFSNRVRP